MRLIVVVLAVLLVVTGCEPAVLGDCTDVAQDEAISSDGRYVAVVFHRDCAATADFTTNLALRDAREKFDPVEQPPVVTVEGRLDIDFEWSARRALVVTLPSANTVRKREEAWRDVRIEYR